MMDYRKISARYIKSSELARIPAVEGLVAYIATHATAKERGDKYGEACRAVEWIDSSTAKECLQAIESLPQGEDPANYMYCQRQYITSRSSFVHDLRTGAPSTSSRTSAPHVQIPLFPGRDYFSQFVVKGDVCQLISTGWSGFYYSDSRCQETVKSISTYLGRDWVIERLIRCHYQGVPQGLAAIWQSRTASKVTLAFHIVGQGVIEGSPAEKLTDIREGVAFHNVMDTHHNQTRAGCTLLDGVVWQY